MRVLWADDDPMIRSVMATNLEAEGFDVQTVADGDAAYEEAVRIRPDVLVLDIMMPGHDGYAVLRELRLNPDDRGGAGRAPHRQGDRRRGVGGLEGRRRLLHHRSRSTRTELTDFIDHLLFDFGPGSAAALQSRSQA